jgi:hypothetical protein
MLHERGASHLKDMHFETFHNYSWIYNIETTKEWKRQVFYTSADNSSFFVKF